jgi:hypothetical protein
MDVMKLLSELIDNYDSAWTLVLKWLSLGNIEYQILDTAKDQSDNALLNLQITTKSTLGGIVYNTGGILFDYGWLKILGSGNEKICKDILYWNGMGRNCLESSIKGALIIGYDVLGGGFAMNGGKFNGKIGEVFYYAPDTLDWEGTGFGYTDFIHWITLGNLNKFYATYRWQGWVEDVKKMGYDNVFNFYPPLWSKEGNVLTSDRQVINIKEIWDLILQNNN